MANRGAVPNARSVGSREGLKSPAESSALRRPCRRSLPGESRRYVRSPTTATVTGSRGNGSREFEGADGGKSSTKVRRKNAEDEARRKKQELKTPRCCNCSRHSLCKRAWTPRQPGANVWRRRGIASAADVRVAPTKGQPSARPTVASTSGRSSGRRG